MSSIEKAKKAQEDLLFAVLEIFKKNPKKLFGPSDITREANLFKRLEDPVKHGFSIVSKNNDRLSQGIINELLNRDKLERVKGKVKDRGKYRYKR